jgi:hypothetical protein
VIWFLFVQTSNKGGVNKTIHQGEVVVVQVRIMFEASFFVVFGSI